MSDYEWIDECFRVEQKRFGTWSSYDKEGQGILTTLSKEHLISATRWYLRAKQEGFPELTIQYDGTVGGKL
ncbi:MAG: DUF7468 family protein [Candidatus Nanopelagicaceae bacterium]